VSRTDGDEPAELRRLRRRIDVLDRRIVRLLNERAELAREVGRVKVTNGRRAIRDAQREREILLRVSIANDGPTPQADLLAIFKRLFAVARSLERSDRTGERRVGPYGGTPPNPED
jgi:chorismate mutase/prephenate dehydratase